jgi:hypothetical protein
MALRLVPKTTVRLDIGDDGDYIDVREDISRRQFNALLGKLPAEGLGDEGTISFSVASTFSEGLFDAFVEGWSVEDAKGKPVAATVDNYNELSRESSQLIDTAISEHFNSLTPDSQEQDKSEDTSEE